jgi:hypothetical protein
MPIRLPANRRFANGLSKNQVDLQSPLLNRSAVAFLFLDGKMPVYVESHSIQ